MIRLIILLILSLFGVISSAAICVNLLICNAPEFCCCDGELLQSCVCCNSTISSCSNGQCILLTPTPTSSHSKTPTSSPSNSKTPTSSPTSSITPTSSETPTPSLSPGASSSITPSISHSSTKTSTRTSTPTPTNTPSSTQSRSGSPTKTLPPIIINQSPSPSATPKLHVSNSPAPLGCYSHPIFQTIDCLNVTTLTKEQVLIVEPLKYKVNFILPIANPVLVKGSLELTPEGEINLLYPYSFLCTDNDLILNGTVAINIDRKLHYDNNITLINCVNQENSHLIIGSGFNLKPVFINNKPKCVNYNIKLLNTSSNNTVRVSIDKYHVKHCLENKVIIIMSTVIPITLAGCCIVLISIFFIIIIIGLCVKLCAYKKIIKRSDNFIDRFYDWIFTHEGENGVAAIYSID